MVSSTASCQNGTRESGKRGVGGGAPGPHKHVFENLLVTGQQCWLEVLPERLQATLVKGEAIREHIEHIRQIIRTYFENTLQAVVQHELTSYQSTKEYTAGH